MDSCQAVDTELDKILAKFEATRRTSDNKIEETLKSLQEIKNILNEQLVIDASRQFQDETQMDLTNLSPAGLSVVSGIMAREAITKAKEASSKVSTIHRDLHPAVSRLGKSIDKNFTQEFNVINCPEALQGRDKLDRLSQAIMEYLYRQGYVDVGNKLAQEAKLEIDDVRALPFMELNHILVSLNEKDIKPALNWAVEHREELERRHSSLEYKLHRLQYIELLRTAPHNSKALLEYCRHFQRFRSAEQVRDVQKLMGALLFLNIGLDKSPYRDLIRQDLWLDVSDTFTKDACALFGLSMESPLTVCVKMGCRAIPMLLNLRAAMLTHQVGEIWNCSKQELPAGGLSSGAPPPKRVRLNFEPELGSLEDTGAIMMYTVQIEVDVTPDYLYHSRFSCPILRQQSTEKNPPMRLNCGHVISKDALQRLASSTKSSKIKCPYCPSEQTPADARRLYL